MSVGMPVKNVHQQTVETVIEYVSNNLSENINLEQMANLAYLSPFHFNRVFRKVTGIPPKEFLSALRIEKSKNLLETTNLRVTDICMDVGYASMGTFTTRFRNAVGVSPKEYRGGGVLKQKEKTTGGKLKNRVVGDILLDAPFDGSIFIGVFSTSSPKGLPVSCAILQSAGTFEISLTTNGTFTLFAVAMPKDRSGDCVLQGSHGPFTVDDENPMISTQVSLNPPQKTDPPILVALPDSTKVQDDRSYGSTNLQKEGCYA